MTTAVPDERDPVWDDEPEEPEPDTWTWRGGAAIVGALVVAAAALLGGQGLYHHLNDSEAVVENYLEAIRAGDLDTALSYAGAGADHPGQLLLPPGKPDWRIGAVETHEAGALVDVDIHGPGKVPAKATFALEHDRRNGWRIDNPFITVVFQSSPFDYITADTARDASSLNFRTQALPGFYDFYRDVPGVAEVEEPQWTPVFPSREEQLDVEPEAVTPGEQATQQAQQQFEALIDDCVAYSAGRPAGCPFGLGSSISGKESLHDFYDVKWKIVSYPKITLTAAETGADPGVAGFGVELTDPGSLTAAGTGVNGDGAGRFLVDCEFSAESWTVPVSAEGTISLRLRGDDVPLDTCPEGES